MRFSDYVKMIRLHLGITQEQLAHDLGISFSTINRWENGHTIPSKLARLRLVEYCSQNKVDENILGQLTKI
jgi:transcriptional regulator with XRE-family HTH domain